MGHGVSHSASNYIPDPGLRNLSPLITHPPDNTKYIVRFFRNSVICQQRAAPCRRHRCIHLLRWVWPVSTNKTMALFPIDQRYGHLAGFAGVLLWCTYRPFPLSYTVMKTDFSFVTISIVAGSSFQSVFSNLLVIIWITYLIEFFK